MDKLKINRFLTLSLTTAITLAASSTYAQAQDSTFGNPIIDAADHGDISQVQTLIQSGANPNQQGELGITPLMRAVYNNNSQLVGMLLQNGASVDIKDVGGANALLIAAREGHFEILQQLVQRGGDVNSRDAEGFTPLMRAAMAGNSGAVQFLLQHGANAGLTNNFGETALSQAKANGQQQVAALLEGTGQTIEQAPAQEALTQAAQQNPIIIRSSVAPESKEEIAEANKADIVIDMSRGRLGADRLSSNLPQNQPQQVATISNPQFYAGSVYVSSSKDASAAGSQDSIPLPQKPNAEAVAQAQPRSIPVDQNLLGNMGQIATHTLRPYKLASDEMVVPGSQNNVLTLGNFKNEEFANRQLSKLTTQYPSLFANLPAKVVQKGGKHPYFQINAGIIGTNQEAREMCKKFLALGINCRAIPTTMKTQDDFAAYNGDVVANPQAANSDLVGAAPAPAVQSQNLNSAAPAAAPAAAPVATPQNNAADNAAQINTFEIQVTPGPAQPPYKVADADAAQVNELAPASGSAPDQSNQANSGSNSSAPVPQVPSLPPLKSIIAPVTPNQPAPSAANPTPPANLASPAQQTPAPAAPMAATPPVAAKPATPGPASQPSSAATPAAAAPSSPAPAVAPAPAPAAAPAVTAPANPAPAPLTAAPAQTTAPAAVPEAANDNDSAAASPISEETAAPVKKKHRFYHRMKIAAAGQGSPPRDLVTGQALGLDAATGKFEVARPVKSSDNGLEMAAPQWIKIDHFSSPQAAHDYIANLREQNPGMGSFRSRVSAPFTRPEATTAQIGPFSDQAQIQQICSSITQSGMTCVPMNSSSPTPTAENAPVNQMPIANDYAPAGDWTIQLGIYGSDTEAQQAWNEFAKHDRHLHKMQNYIVQADGGYRLRAGSFASSAQADSLCDELRAKSISCIIIRN